jgi:hypothetical protein
MILEQVMLSHHAAAPRGMRLDVGRALPAADVPTTAKVFGGQCPPYIKIHASRVRRRRMATQHDGWYYSLMCETRVTLF